MSEEEVEAPPRSKRLKTDVKTDPKKLIIILEDCSLESGKVGNEHVILNSDRYAQFLRKNKKNPAEYRPDILHQCLLMLLDSPLNKAGFLQIFFRTKKNVLVEVNSQCRIPRTFDRFCGLMVQLLDKLCIRASEGSQRLLRVIKNPVTQHLPIGCKKYLTSFNCENLIPIKDIIPPKDTLESIVIVVGGISHGKIVTDYTEGDIKISNFPLSAALCCAKLTTAFEDVWGVV